ncbi:hypothetical protein [Sphingomonas sp. NFR04]|uniref:hypothetical protein n=1 Tax=Sphingomonas sp. NFR04 TaxID=1566283 RepID=UPI0011138A0F|nr:hypothetical protein [Sphingomonas sp. NFR04]
MFDDRFTTFAHEIFAHLRLKLRVNVNRQTITRWTGETSMRSPPMNAPAELRRRIAGSVASAGARSVVVARGSLVLLAHGLSAVQPEQRGECWIETDGATLTAEDTMALLRHWSTGAPFAHGV